MRDTLMLYIINPTVKYYLLVATIVFFCSSGFCQDTLAITQDFAIGKTYKFEIKRGKEDSRNPVSQGLFTVTSAIAKVTEGQDDSRVVTFMYGDSRIEGIDVPQELAEQFKGQELYNGIEIKLIVDPEGNFIGLSNYESATKQIENTFIKNYERHKTTIEEAKYNQMKQQLAVTYDTEEKLLDTYFPELSIYFNAFGNFYIKGEPQELLYEATNPFGGAPFPMSATATFNELEGSIAIIKVTETIEAADLQRVMLDTFKKIAESAGQPFDETEIPEFNMITSSELKYDVSKNLLVSFSINKRVTATNVNQNTITEIRMLD